MGAGERPSQGGEHKQLEHSLRLILHQEVQQMLQQKTEAVFGRCQYLDFKLKTRKYIKPDSCPLVTLTPQKLEEHQTCPDYTDYIIFSRSLEWD